MGKRPCYRLTLPYASRAKSVGMAYSRNASAIPCSVAHRRRARRTVLNSGNYEGTLGRRRTRSLRRPVKISDATPCHWTMIGNRREGNFDMKLRNFCIALTLAATPVPAHAEASYATCYKLPYYDWRECFAKIDFLVSHTE